MKLFTVKLYFDGKVIFFHKVEECEFWAALYTALIRRDSLVIAYGMYLSSVKIRVLFMLFNEILRNMYSMLHSARDQRILTVCVEVAEIIDCIK